MRKAASQQATSTQAAAGRAEGKLAARSTLSHIMQRCCGGCGHLAGTLMSPHTAKAAAQSQTIQRSSWRSVLTSPFCTAAAHPRIIGHSLLQLYAAVHAAQRACTELCFLLLSTSHPAILPTLLPFYSRFLNLLKTGQCSQGSQLRVPSPSCCAFSSLQLFVLWAKPSRGTAAAPGKSSSTHGQQALCQAVPGCSVPQGCFCFSSLPKGTGNGKNENACRLPATAFQSGLREVTTLKENWFSALPTGICRAAEHDHSMRYATVLPSLHSPYGSSLVVMPISSDVFGTLLSTAGTCSGCSASCRFLRKYFLQSSSAKTQHQAVSVLLCYRVLYNLHDRKFPYFTHQW